MDAPVEDYSVVIGDWLTFGDLVKFWASNPEAVPQSVGQFKDQVPEAVVRLGMDFKDSDPIQTTHLPPKTKLSLVLPDPVDLEPLAPGQSYPLPDFYSLMAFDRRPDSIEDTEEFRSCRIADYAMRKCV